MNPISHRSIVFMVTELGRGGAETQLVRIAQCLKERGWDVGVISLMPLEGYEKNLADAGIPTESLGMRRRSPNLSAIVRLARLLRDRRPAILTTFLYHANLLGRLVGRASRIPVIVTSVRGSSFGGFHRFTLEVVLERCRLNQVTTTNSENVRRRLISAGVAREKRSLVIPNGIDIADYERDESVRDEVRAELTLGPADILLLAVGNLREVKDYPTMLRAFDIAHMRFRRTHLYIAGKGTPPWSAVPPETRKRVDGVVHFLGQRDDVARLLKAADALVLSSRSEGLPNAIMEALATGIPVVSTDVGGVRELIEDGVSGYLAPPGDWLRLGEMISTVVALPPETRKSMGDAGRGHVREHFGLTGVVDRWESLFVGLLADYQNKTRRRANV